MALNDTAPNLQREEDDNILMWLLVWGELAIFAALLVAFLIKGVQDPQGFAAAKSHLAARTAGLNTIVLLLSGWQAAQAVIPSRSPLFRRIHLLSAGLLGFVFIALKIVEYGQEWVASAAGGSPAFWELYYLTTGFHLAHVAFLSGLLLLFAWRPPQTGTGTVVVLWHVTDLVWLAIFSIVYLS